MNIKEVIISEYVYYELDSIFLFISKDSIKRAENILTTILLEAYSLYEFPKKGRVIPELNKENYRELLIQNYRIMYKIKDEKIIISAVRHSSREFNFEDLK